MNDNLDYNVNNIVLLITSGQLYDFVFQVLCEYKGNKTSVDVVLTADLAWFVS